MVEMSMISIFAAALMCIAQASSEPGYGPPPIISAVVQVSLERNDQPFGVGAIIGPQFVLTTATLVQSKPLNELFVIVNDNFQRANFSVKRIDYYYNRYEAEMPNGGSRMVHNIALIQINGSFDFDNMKIAPLHLVDQGYKAKANQTVYLRGFDEDRDPASLVMSIVNFDKCNEIFQDRGGIYQGELCAKSEQFFLCQGDQGSPFLTSYNRSLVGIASWLNECPRENHKYAVFVDVGFYRDWIDATMNLMLGRAAPEFQRSWSDPWFAEKWFEALRKGDVSCEIGPKRETIRWDHCYRGCDEVRGVNGECVDNQCTCPNMAQDQPLYDLIHGISQPNIKNPYCSRRPCRE